jgi:site-specific DNA-cytosine methylase
VSRIALCPAKIELLIDQACVLCICIRLYRHAIEKDPIAAATLNLNHGQHTAVFPQDMETFFAEAKKAEEGSLYYCGHTSHGHASSPCQGFSRINTTGSEASKEKNNQLCLTWPEFIISQKMTTGSFENVTGMLGPKRVPYIQRIVNKFIMNRYQVRVGGKREVGFENKAHCGPTVSCI